MKAIFLDEPELEFYGSRHIDIRFGIANYGPLDQELPSAPKMIRVGIVGSPQSVEGVRLWFDKCREPIAAKVSKQPNLFPAFPGFNVDAAFRSSLVLDDVLCRNLPPTALKLLEGVTHDAAVQQAVGLFIEEIRFLAEHHKPHVVVCAIPLGMLPAITRPTTEAGEPAPLQDSSYDFHDLLKAQAMRWRTPIQVVLPSTYDETLQTRQTRAGVRRQLQDEATRAWNLHCALYYKAGGVPWQLRRESTDLASCFVGISFYRTFDKASLHTSVAQVFNQRGEGVVVRGATATISKEDRQPHLSADDAFTLLKDALARYRDVHKHPPARLVVHKSSRYNAAERDGFARALADERIDLFDLVSLGDAGVRLFREGPYPPLRGTMLSLDERNCILYTKGSVSFFETYPGLYVPSPLLIRSELTQETQRGLAREILALTKMNWNNTQFDGAAPVTLRAAQQVKEILRFCDVATVIEPHYSFYM